MSLARHVIAAVKVEGRT